jgi:hypothetical protein
VCIKIAEVVMTRTPIRMAFFVFAFMLMAISGFGQPRIGTAHEITGTGSGIFALVNPNGTAMCAAMNGDYDEANKNAALLAAHVAPHVKDMPPLEGFMMTIPIAMPALCKSIQYSWKGRNTQLKLDDLV